MKREETSSRRELLPNTPQLPQIITSIYFCSAESQNILVKLSKENPRRKKLWRSFFDMWPPHFVRMRGASTPNESLLQHFNRIPVMYLPQRFSSRQVLCATGAAAAPVCRESRSGTSRAPCRALASSWPWPSRNSLQRSMHLRA